MKVIDRYTTRSFFVVLLGSIIAILVMFVVLDLVENMENFIDEEAPLIAAVLYYLNYAPWIVVLTLPVAMLLASLSTVGTMTRDYELVALKASGVSPYRIIRILAVIALLVSAADFVISETVIPHTNEQKAMVWNRYVEKRGRTSSTETVNRTLSLGDGRTLFVKRYNSEDQVGLDVMLAESSDILPLRTLQAQQMRFLGNGGEWELEQVKERVWDGNHEVYAEHESLREILPAVTPAELAIHRREPEEMGFAELLDYVRRGRIRGRDMTRGLVDLNMKVALPFANFIIVLFGASLAAIRRRAGLAVGFAMSILICFVYYVVIRTGQAIGYNGNLPPALAAWMGNIIFGTLSLVFLARARY